MTREQAIKELTELLPEEFLSEYAEAIRMAIKALEQEPCGDAVSRQAVLDVIKKCHCEEWVKADIGAPIEALPSVTPQPNKWIPVSERLPEVGQRIIATIESIDGNYVRETIYDKHGFLCGKGIAWMPLPEPYLPDINVGNMSEIPTGAEGSDKE